MKGASSVQLANQIFLYACAVEGPQDWDGHEGALRRMDRPAWEMVSALAVKHGFLGLIARSLEWAKDRTGFNAPILDQLNARRQGQLVQHLLHRATARRVLDAMAARNIACIIFKGIVAAEEIYGDLSLRGFRDLDIMVRLECVDEAYAVALALGYRLCNFEHVQDYVKNGLQAAQMSHADGTSLDLHWTLTLEQANRENLDIIWKGCRLPETPAQLPGLRLSLEMTLIHFATHFHHHDYKEFKPLLDFNMAARALGHRVNVDELISRAEALGLLPVVKIAARLCKQHFKQHSASGTLINTLALAKPSMQERLACRFLTPDRLLHADEYSRLSDWLTRLCCLGTLNASMRSLRKLLLPRPGELVILFARAFSMNLYPKYYGRRLHQAFTGSNKKFSDFQ
jgi:hypothetical protein